MSFLKINALALDKEWLEQPPLYYEYATKLADARRAYDKAQAELSLTTAELSQAIRKEPSKFGLDKEKPTEGSINATLQTRPKYREAAENVADARHDMDINQAAVTALEHRKRALTMLVELHGQNYFSSPKVAGNDALRELSRDAGKRDSRSKLRGLRDEDDEKPGE